MKSKTNLIQGIIICAQSIILDAFALYALIPLLGNLWFGDLYDDEKAVAVFSLIIWIGVSIGASIALNIGKNKLVDYFSDGSSTNNGISTYSSKTSVAAIFKEHDTMNAVSAPSNSEWKCSNCGKINRNYTGTCGCGQQKPNR